LRPVDIGLDAEIEGRIPHDQRLAFQVGAAKGPQIEQHRRHHGGDDGGIQIGEGELFQCEQLAEPHRIFVGGARHLGHCPPLLAHFLAVIDGEDDIGVAGIDGEQHLFLFSRGRTENRKYTFPGRAHQKNTSPAVMARVCLPSFRSSAPWSSMPSNTPNRSSCANRARMEEPSPAARASQACRSTPKPSAIQLSYHFAKAWARTARAVPGSGGATPSAASEVAGYSVSGGKWARLIPMPMARLGPARSSSRPDSFFPLASTSLGHLTAIPAWGAKCAAISAAAMAAAKLNCGQSDCGRPGVSKSVAARFPLRVCQRLPRRPRPALCRAALIHTGPRSPALARRMASSLVESSSS